MRVLCLLFAVLLLFSLATPGKTGTGGGAESGVILAGGCLLSSLCAGGQGQPKSSCDGYCSYVCGKIDEWTFSPSCGKMYCCVPSPKKGR
ncbi:small basic protein 1-like protein [Pitangus sulphuratus]|nr:small basic protein 1-like protein [Pitangus sulphuratus]